MICKNMSNLTHTSDTGTTLIQKLINDILKNGVTCHEILAAGLPDKLLGWFALNI